MNLTDISVILVMSGAVQNVCIVLQICGNL